MSNPNYDPVKAHEYYMRTRELKGRRSTTKLNDEGKKVWAYTKNEISGEKKEKVKEEQEKRKQKIAELRAKAKATREQISAKLKELNTQLTEESSSRRSRVDSRKKSDLEDIGEEAEDQKERIDEKKNTEIERLMAIEIPSGLSKEERADNSANAKSEREKVSTELKAAVTAAREAYKGAKENLDATYEDLYQQEFDKIASEYKAVKKRKRRK
jgi:hypothetical protein